MEDKKAIAELFNRYVNRETNATETSVLLEYFHTEQGAAHLHQLIEERFKESAVPDATTAAKLQPLTDRVGLKLNAFIQADVSKPSGKTRKLYGLVAFAASLLLICSVFLFYNKYQQDKIQNVTAIDVKPGGNKATLILSGGRRILLDSTKTGIALSTENFTYADGSSIGNETGISTETATLTTPAGGQYNITLPDGTLVTLNASSSLKFPSTFLGLVNRSVELEGEGYFTVFKDKKHPFLVKSKGQQVEVLGTEFNISAYPNEPNIKTTLVGGSVKLSTHDTYKILKPGQQAQVETSGNVQLADVDIDDAIAWKNGYFIFNEDLQSIMNKIARWYDVEIIYRNQPNPNLAFQGKITRSRNLSEVLKMMEYNGKVHFKTEGRKIIVTN